MLHSETEFGSDVYFALEDTIHCIGVGGLELMFGVLHAAIFLDMHVLLIHIVI